MAKTIEVQCALENVLKDWKEKEESYQRMVHFRDQAFDEKRNADRVLESAVLDAMELAQGPLTNDSDIKCLVGDHLITLVASNADGAVRVEKLKQLCDQQGG